MANQRLFGVSFGMPRFFLFLLAVFSLSPARVIAAPDVVAHAVTGSDFISAKAAMIESIENEGLVVGAVIPFRDMLVRTGGESGSPYRDAELIQFCSSIVARQIVLEDPEQIAFCPMMVAIYVTKAKPEIVVLAYRTPAQGSSARQAAAGLLERIVRRAVELAPLK